MLDKLDINNFINIACYLQIVELKRLKKVCKKFNNCSIIDLLIKYRVNNYHKNSKIIFNEIYVWFTAYFNGNFMPKRINIFNVICNCLYCNNRSFANIEIVVVNYKTLYNIYNNPKFYNKLLYYNNLSGKMLDNYLEFKEKVGVLVCDDDNALLKLIYQLYNNKHFIKFLLHNNYSFNKKNNKTICIKPTL